MATHIVSGGVKRSGRPPESKQRGDIYVLISRLYDRIVHGEENALRLFREVRLVYTTLSL